MTTEIQRMEIMRTLAESVQRALASGGNTPRNTRRLQAMAIGLADLTPPDDVPEIFSCPDCGERHTDRLEIQEDERVRCLTCGCVFDPEAD